MSPHPTTGDYQTAPLLWLIPETVDGELQAPPQYLQPGPVDPSTGTQKTFGEAPDGDTAA
jgi:hypothetical protein